MTPQEQRIRLAKLQGWQQHPHCPDKWFNDAPQHRREECRWTDHLPNPEHNANDAEQLVRFLNERGYTVSVQFHSQGGFWVELASWTNRSDVRSLNCGDWKTGLVELAMKIVGEGYDHGK